MAQRFRLVVKDLPVRKAGGVLQNLQRDAAGVFFVNLCKAPSGFYCLSDGLCQDMHKHTQLPVALQVINYKYQSYTVAYKK